MGIMTVVGTKLDGALGRVRGLLPGGVNKTDDATREAGRIVGQTNASNTTRGLDEGASLLGRLRGRIAAASTPFLIGGSVVVLWILYEMRII